MKVVVGWLRGSAARVTVYDPWYFPVLWLDLRLTGNHCGGKPSAKGQTDNKANSAFHPFGVYKWVVSDA